MSIEDLQRWKRDHPGWNTKSPREKREADRVMRELDKRLGPWCKCEDCARFDGHHGEGCIPGRRPVLRLGRHLFCRAFIGIEEWAAMDAARARHE